MTEDESLPRRATCPVCGVRLSPPVSGDVHCYVDCPGCHARYELDDPALALPP